MTDDVLTGLVARLAIELSETAPDTALYEQRSIALGEWLMIHQSWTVDSTDDSELE